MDYKEQFKGILLSADESAENFKKACASRIADTTIGTKVIKISEEAKAENVKQYCNDVQPALRETESEYAKEIAKLCSDFVNDFKLNLFDESGTATDTAGAFNTAVVMINTLGDKLDAETLETVIRPLKCDKEKFNLAKRMVSVKSDSYGSLEYTALLGVFDKVLGIADENGLIEEYNEFLQKIEDIILNPGTPIAFTIKPNGTSVDVNVEYSYTLLTLPDLMNKVMELYNAIFKTIPELHLEEKELNPLSLGA